ncbi:YegP family protein [Parahaliea mediterranea]|uniref:YegP family protein n=1 Tax=Parahaliea mediterranea TaxID=651086 RepID=UPI000E2F8DDF|nr:YegP family protein [Parahaliea mediterranea]
MAGKFELKQGDSGKYSFNLKSGNGQVILTSQTYESHDSAINGIESVRRNAADDGRFQRKVASDGSPYFVLTATNGQTIGKSQMYSGDSAMENGIASVKSHAAEAALSDLTREG